MKNKRYRPGQHKMYELRATVIERDGGGCFYCDEPGALTLDHIVPQAYGGLWVPENLVIACETCNSRRGTLDAEAFHRIVQSEKARGIAPARFKPVRRGARMFKSKYPWMERGR
jgi:5-methylcytosine-specific restriction endonuclease McrA